MKWVIDDEKSYPIPHSYNRNTGEELFTSYKCTYVETIGADIWFYFSFFYFIVLHGIFFAAAIMTLRFENKMVFFSFYESNDITRRLDIHIFIIHDDDNSNCVEPGH